MMVIYLIELLLEMLIFFFFFFVLDDFNGLFVFGGDFCFE